MPFASVLSLVVMSIENSSKIYVAPHYLRKNVTTKTCIPIVLFILIILEGVETARVS